ncbi:hypothetical protein JHK87_010228 [Glycine soja]|nr:hypothetical protein JHK87_010228 [Glycine soja]
MLVVGDVYKHAAIDQLAILGKQIGITGAILTKLDADSRGGAALTFREVGIGLLVLQQLTGINGVFFYYSKIFAAAALRMSIKIHQMLNSKMLIDAHGDQIAATSLLEASNLVGLKWQLSLTWIGPLWTLVGSYYFRQGVIGMEEFYGNILSWD